MIRFCLHVEIPTPRRMAKCLYILTNLASLTFPYFPLSPSYQTKASCPSLFYPMTLASLHVLHSSLALHYTLA